MEVEIKIQSISFFQKYFQQWTGLQKNILIKRRGSGSTLST